MNKLHDSILDVLEENDFSVCSMDEQNGKTVAELEWYSPAGEDVIITVWFNGTNSGFVDGFTNYAADFDPDEHAEMWVESRGKNGVPSSIRELINDADAINEMLESMAIKLNALVILDAIKGGNDHV